MMKWFWDHYLGSADDGSNPLASPLLAEDLAGLPRAVVYTAEFDPLRDEGEAYAARLELPVSPSASGASTARSTRSSRCSVCSPRPARRSTARPQSCGRPSPDAASREWMRAGAVESAEQGPISRV